MGKYFAPTSLSCVINRASCICLGLFPPIRISTGLTHSILHSTFFSDMLDSPVSGNSASTRSSSDSYSSSSSTKQLLSSNPSTTAANIIVDDKTALQNAVNV